MKPEEEGPVPSPQGGSEAGGNCAGEANLSMPTMFSGNMRAQNAGKCRECNLFPLQNAGIITDQFKTPIISHVRIAKGGITVRLASISPALDALSFSPPMKQAK